MATYQWRADAFQPMSDEYIYCFLEHEQQAIRGEYHAFDHSYLPRLRAQGVQLVNMAIGGERCAQVLYSDTDVHRFWDAHKKLDILNSELEAGCSSFVLCKPRTIWRVPNQRAKLQSLQHWLVAVRSKERPT